MGIMGLHCKVWQVWGSVHFVFSDFGFEFSDCWFRASGLMLGAFSRIRSHCERRGEKRCYLPAAALPFVWSWTLTVKANPKALFKP